MSKQELSPDISKRRNVKGLHTYADNKENISCNSSPKSSHFEFNLKSAGKTSEAQVEKKNENLDIPPPVDEAEPLEASSLFESVYIMDDDQDKIKEHTKKEMEKFDLAYDIERKEMLQLTEEEKKLIYDPQFTDIFEYVKYVTFKSKMEAEIPIISLIYIEKLIRKWGVLVNIHNWRRIVLITLCIGSKIWDDDSLENVHFPKVMSDITLKDISMLEKSFLNLIDYDVIIRGKEYAKYYFIMTTLGEESKKNPPWRLMNPSNVIKIENQSQIIQEKLINDSKIDK